MPDFSHSWEHAGTRVTFTWLGELDVVPDRVYAFAFTSEGKVFWSATTSGSPRILVPEPKFQDILFWGRRDSRAPFLLARAMDFNRQKK